MKMRILLAYPPLNEHTSYWLPHIGLGYLAAVLAKNHDVCIKDCVAERVGFDKFREFVSRNRFDLVGITSTTYEISNAHKIAEIAKAEIPSTVVVVGGPHSTALPEQTLKEFQYFDIAVAGEGEKTVEEIACNIEAKKPLSGIRGIAYRDNGKIKVNDKREFINNLDDLPIPLWEKFPLEKYHGYLGLIKKKELPILSGRGCPNQCVFCQRASGSKPRLRSVKSVVDEIEYDIKCGARSLAFCDETFTLFKERTKEICEEIIRRGLNKKISWHCETRVDRIDKETLMKMKEAGCEMVAFGVESGNDFILQKAKKGISTAQIRRAFIFAKEVGLKTYMFLIFGLPYETEKTVKDTINLMMEVDPDYVTIGILVPFPGTEVFEMASKGEGFIKILSNNWNDYGKQIGKSLELETITSKRLRELQSQAYSKFYLRPSKIRNLLELASFKGILQMLIQRSRDVK